MHAQDASKAADSLQSLQGTWEGVERGREAEGKYTVTIIGQASQFQGPIKEESYLCTFELPVGTTPAQWNNTIADCPAKEYVGKVSLGIYKLENGTLTLITHRPGDPQGPKGFEDDGVSRTFILKKR